MIQDKILRDVATISDTDGKQKKLLLVSRGKGTVYDFREWTDDRPGDGITMTPDELKRLGAAIKATTLYGDVKR